jgi:hypothetical protein
LGFRSVNNPVKPMDLTGKFTIFGIWSHSEERGETR